MLWATGFRPDYRWLDLPVVDAKGQLEGLGFVVQLAQGSVDKPDARVITSNPAPKASAFSARSTFSSIVTLFPMRKSSIAPIARSPPGCRR